MAETRALDTRTMSDPRRELRIGNPGLVGTIAAVSAGAMDVFAVTGFFLGTRNLSGRSFVPSGVTFNNYGAVMATMTLGLASLATGWAMTSLRVGNRRWASSGFGLVVLLDFAALNLVWTVGRALGPGVRGSEYAVVSYASMALAGIFIGIALVTAAAGLARVLGGQTTGTQPHLGYASAWVQHLATLAWVLSWAVIYLRK